MTLEAALAAAMGRLESAQWAAARHPDGPESAGLQTHVIEAAAEVDDLRARLGLATPVAANGVAGTDHIELILSKLAELATREEVQKEVGALAQAVRDLGASVAQLRTAVQRQKPPRATAKRSPG